MLRSRRGAKPTKHESFSRSSSFIRLAPAQWSSVPPPGARRFLATGDVYMAGKALHLLGIVEATPAPLPPYLPPSSVCTLIHFVDIMRVFSRSLMCGLFSLPSQRWPWWHQRPELRFLAHVCGSSLDRTYPFPTSGGGECFQQITPRRSKPPPRRREKHLAARLSPGKNARTKQR